MKLLSIIGSADIGGAEINVEHIVRYLDADHIVVSLAEGPMVDRWLSHGATVEVIPTADKFPIKAKPELEALIRETRPDVIHTHTAKAHLLAAISRLSAPSVMTIHGSHKQFASSRRIPAAWYRWADQWSARKVSRIIAVCEADRRAFAEAGFSSSKLVLVPNGIPDPGVYKDGGKCLDGPATIAWIGRSSPEKRPELMLEIARHIATHPALEKIRIVGPGEELAGRAREISAKIQVDPVLHPLTSLWEESLLSINTSASEGASLAVLEALASGIPVIASAVGGNPEILANAGFVVADKATFSETAAEFASIIKTLLEDRDYCLERSRLARKRYLERYTVERMVEALSGIYRSLRLRYAV